MKRQSRFREDGERLKALTIIVKRDWDKLPEEIREELKTTAYQSIEAIDNKSIWTIVPAIAWGIYLRVTRQYDDFIFCIEQTEILADYILSALEREDLYYQATLSEALSELEEDAGSLSNQ